MNALGYLVLIIFLILLVVIVGLLVIPVPPLTGSMPAAQKTKADSRFINIKDLNVHYTESGQGSLTFILLHGFGASVFSWREVSKPLADYGRVIAFDRPAFGLTGRPLVGGWQGVNPYSLDEQVEITVGLMDELEIDRVILVGHSAGGAVAAAAALQYPQRFSALILVDAAIYSTNGIPGWLQPILNTALVDKWGPYFARTVANGQFNRLLERAWHDPAKITPSIRDGYREPFMVDGWDQALWELIKTFQKTGLENQIEQLQIPVLVLSGDDDRVIPVEESLRLAREIPGAEVQILPACGHIPQEECPQAFLDRVISFLEAHP